MAVLRLVKKVLQGEHMGQIRQMLQGIANVGCA
jgi:hypothetical protein